MKDFWSYDVNDILNSLNTSSDGLSNKEAEDRIDKFGENIFEEKKFDSKFMIFISQFKNPITMILILRQFFLFSLKIIPTG